MQKSASGHPNIGERNQSDELRRVFLEPKIAHLGEDELAFDNSERLFHLGPHIGLEFLGLFGECAPRCVLLLLTFEIKAKVFLFHAVVDSNLRASVKQIGAEF